MLPTPTGSLNLLLRSCFLALLCLVFCLPNLNAQDSTDSEQLQLILPMVQVDMRVLTPRALRDTAGVYRYGRAAHGMMIPLAEHWFIPDGKLLPRLFYMSLNSRFSFINAPVQPLREYRSINYSVGVNLFMMDLNRNHFFSFYSGLATNEDVNQFSRQIRPRFVGMAMYKKQFSSRLGVHAGLASNPFLRQNNYPIALLGFNTLLAENMTLTATVLLNSQMGIRIPNPRGRRTDRRLPIDLSITYRYNEKWQFTTALKPEAGFNTYTDVNSDFVSSEEVFYLRNAAYNLGVRIDHSPNSNFTFFGEAGVSSGRTISIQTRRDTLSTRFYNTRIGPTFYANVGFKLSIGRVKYPSPDLTDINLEEIDLYLLNLDGLDFGDIQLDNLNLEEIDLDDLDLDNVDLEDLDGG